MTGGPSKKRVAKKGLFIAILTKGRVGHERYKALAVVE